jgi:hypothetical protein
VLIVGDFPGSRFHRIFAPHVCELELLSQDIGYSTSTLTITIWLTWRSNFISV